GVDEIRGGKGNDRIWGGPDDDFIWTGRGRDRAWGDGGDDRLESQALEGQGTTRLWGGEGDDDLVARLGTVVMRGDAGDDDFRVETAIGREADISIMDLEQGESVEIAFLLGEGGSTAVRDGADTLITYADLEVRLRNVDVDQLDKFIEVDIGGNEFANIYTLM
ncbi:MAG: hypothetical protein AAF192_21875, partial [Pseudomonadota bacterium]